MTPPIRVDGRSHSIAYDADDGPARDMDLHQECEGLSPASDIDVHLELTSGRSVDNISTYSDETETVFSQNDGSVVTGPTDSTVSSKGRKGSEREIITLSCSDDQTTVDPKGTLRTPKRCVSSPPTKSIVSGSDRAGLPSNPTGSLVITPTMNSPPHWKDIINNAPALENVQVSVDVPDSVRKSIDRFNADLSSGAMPFASGSGLGGDVAPPDTGTAPAMSTVVKNGNALKSTRLYGSVGLNMLSSRQMNEAALKIRCWAPPAVNPVALRFGLDKTISLHNLGDGESITFVCCDETFPSPEWAKEAAERFREGAQPWTSAGLIFKQVKRFEPAYFRIAFSLLPTDLDDRVIAEAFFPGTPQPEDRTLWVYKLAFESPHRNYMAGYMAHEAGHIGGSRHGFDEHILHDGSEISRFKSVNMGADDPKSVMNYYDNPADFMVQQSDIDDMKDMYNHAGNKYEGYSIRKFDLATHVYLQM
ncbi:hypothetical protein F5B17DRAFT_412756 [Nemania serpens]|nr:hypothetical protein F5B17DRAFT_412756 [Nemania serpens]